MKNTVASASFVSVDTLQLRLELGTVLDGVQTTVIPDGLTPNEEGWVFQDGGYLGRIGGRDQEYWTPVDKFEQSDIADLFDRAENGGVLQAPADDLSNWIVRVNGQRVDVEGISRKSNIQDTAETGWFAFDFRTVENVFLDLAEPLTEGDTVSVRYNDPDFDAVATTYSPAETISEAVHVNLAGFDPDDTVKTAYLSSWNGFEVDGSDPRGGKSTPQQYEVGTRFQVVNETTGQVVKSGEIELNQSVDEQSRFSGLNFHQTDVWKMDFSDVNGAGRYHVVVDGIGRSESFDIKDTHWDQLFDVAFSGFYHQRSGIALDEELTDFARPRSLHPDDGFVILQSTVKLTDTNEGYDTSGDLPGFDELLPGSETGEILLDAWGGWHDAGDFDRRAQHIEASRKLIELAELEPDFAERADGRIPEADDRIPDLVDEALWNLDLFRRLQKDDGGVPGGIESERNPNFGEGSWGDSLELYAYAPDVWSTWEYASGAAKAASILKSYDPAAVQGWTDSAIAAMEWAEANAPTSLDAEQTNARNLAALELYRLTGDEAWHDVFKASTSYGGPDLSNVDFRSQQLEAAFVYARMDSSQTDDSIRALALEDLTREGEVLLDLGQASGFDYTVNPYAPYGWGNTAQQPNYSADVFMRLHALTGDQTYLDKLQEDVQYTLGANPLNMSFMTGIDGVRSPEEILNVDADVLGYGPPPGITIYGDYNISDYGYQFYHGIMQDDVWPNYFDAPVSESFNGFTVFVPSAEYTLQQGIADMTAVIGYLAAQQESISPNFVEGTSGDDRLRGTGGDDIILGNRGNDILEGGAGGDELNGGADRDAVDYSNSTLGIRAHLSVAATHKKIATGDAIGDTFFGVEDILGSAFNDDLRGTSIRNDIYGGDGDDRLRGFGGDDNIFGGEGDDLLRGDFGNDTLTGGLGADDHEGGVGRDTVSYADASGGIKAHMSNNTTHNNIATGEAIGDTFLDVEDMLGSEFNDDLRGTSVRNDIYGGSGDDRLRGFGGDDNFLGGAGDDLIRGDFGSDDIDGGTGNDELEGGVGNDKFIFKLGYEIDTITDFENDRDQIDLLDFGIDSLANAMGTYSQDGNDLVFSFNAGADQLIIENFTTAQLSDDDFVMA